jgi:hypothetical protein
MHIKNNPSFLLFIEPKGKPSAIPIIDEYTKKIAGAMQNAQSGASNYSSGNSAPAKFVNEMGYKGWHTCSCNAGSDNKDYLLKTADPDAVVKVFKTSKDFFHNSEQYSEEQAVITNNLALHYVAFHRDEIPVQELEKISLLQAEPTEPVFETC